MTRIQKALALLTLLLFTPETPAQIVNNPAPSAQLSTQDVRGAVVLHGSVATIAFPVDPGPGGGDLFRVVLQSPQAVVTLVAPGGTEVTASNAQSLGYEYTAVADGTAEQNALVPTVGAGPSYVLIMLPESPAAGTYQVKVDASSLPADVSVIASYFSSSALKAGVTTTAGQYRTNERVFIHGVVFDGPAPVTNAVVTARVIDQADDVNQPVSVTLQDGGQYDAAAGDGIYTGTFVPTLAGDYVVGLRATGTGAGGAAYSRTVGTSFRVIVPPASFTSFTDAGADDNANGLYDRLVVNANLSVGTAGRYQFGVTLAASNGKELTARSEAVLAAGSQQLPVSFAAKDVLALGVGGPYELRNASLTLMGAAENQTSDFRESAGQTLAYARTSFERPAILFTGNNSAAGVDTNGNGKYDLLRVQAEVDVRAAGYYTWSGGLRDPGGKQIDLVADDGNLPAGLNTVTLDFDGTKIARNDKDGPYSVTSVLMYSSDASAIVDELMKTQPFSVADFECAGVVAPPIQSAALTPATVIGGNSTKLRVNFAQAAGACGAKISLSSSNPSAIAAVIPTDVIVAPGQNFVEASVVTSGVAATTQVVLTATAGATSESVTLTITPSALKNLTLAFPSIQAGGAFAGKVELDGAAPPGGASVALSSSDPVNAPVAATVVVPAGVRDAEFVVQTNAALQASVSPVFSASYGGVTKTASITIFGEVFIDGSITPGGPPVTVNAAQPGQNFRLAFAGAAGQRVSVRITGVTIGANCCGSRVSVKNPDGTYLLSPQWAGLSGSFIEPLTLPTAGTYNLIVDPVEANTGGMTLTMYDVPPDVSAAVTPGGPPVTVTTTTPGQNARATFAGAAGQRVSLKVGGLTFNYGYVTIYKPDGTPLTNSAFAGAGGTFIDAVTLPSAGDYTVLVDPTEHYTGGATLTLYDVPADVSGSISAGGSPVTVATSAPGQKALLTFNGTSGQRVSLKVTGVSLTGGSGYADVYIKKPDNGTLASTTASSSGAFIDTQTLAVAGAYSVSVIPRDTNVGSLTLTLYNVPADATGSIPAPGTPVTVTTSVPGQNAAVSFNGAAGQRVTVNVGGVNLTGGNGYVDVFLRKPDGATLGSATYVSSGGGFINTQTLEAAGVYTIYVNPQGSNTGSVTLTLNDVSADVTGAVTTGGPSVTVTTTSAGQNARLTFDGAAGQRVSVNVSTTFGGCWYLNIYKPDGSLLTGGNNCGSASFVDPVALPVSGTYTILIDPSGAAVGSATVTLYDVVDVSGSATVGGPAVSTTIATPGQVSRLTFDAAAGQRVSINVTTTFSGCWYLNVYRPDGSLLTGGNNCGSSSFIDPLTLPAGTYTVLINPSGAGTGTATVRLYDVTDTTDTAVLGGPAVSVSVGTPGQVARLAFEGTAGQRVSVNSTSNFTGCWNLGLYKPDGSQLTNVFYCGSSIFVEPQLLPATGTYTVRVDPSGTGTGTANVRLYEVVDLTGTAEVGGPSVTNTIATPGQVARLTFAGTAGQRVSVNSVSNFNGSGCWNLGVYKPDGSQLSNTFNCGSTFVEPQALPVSGTYTLVIDPSGAITGTATVRLYDVVDLTGTLVINDPAVGLTTNAPGQNARLTFAGTAGQQVTVRVTGSTYSCVRVTLLKPDNTSVTNVFSCGSSFNLSTQTLPTTGTYAVTVDPNSASIGSISVRVTSP